MDDMFNQFFGGGQGGGRGGQQGNFNFDMGGGQGQQQEQPKVDPFENSDVIRLNLNTLSSFYRRKMVWVIFFYKSDHPKTEKVVEEFKILAEKLHGIIGIGAIDCEEDEEICEELAVSKAPKVKIYTEKSSDKGEFFKGKFEWKPISSKANSKMESFVSIVTENVFNDFMNREKDNFKALLFTNKKSTPPMYKALSKFSKKFSFGLVRESDALTKSFKISKFPSMCVVTGQYEHKADCFDGEIKLENLKGFLRDYLNGKKTAKASVQSGLLELTKKKFDMGLCGKHESKFCFIFFSTGSHADRRLQINIEKSMATFERSPVIFTYVDKTENGEFFTNFGTHSQIIIYKPKRNRYAEYTNDKTDVETLKMFIDGILSGNGRFTRLDTYPSFEYIKDDL